jgi:hypothetical protein
MNPSPNADVATVARSAAVQALLAREGIHV